MGVHELVELLARVPLFAGAQERHLQVLAFSAERETRAADSLLFSAGERLPAGFLILAGSARGEPREVEGASLSFSRGDFLGEVPMIAGTPHHMTVRALRELRVLRLPRELFLRVCGEFPEFGAQVMNNFARLHMDALRQDLRVLHERLLKTPGLRDIGGD